MRTIIVAALGAFGGTLGYAYIPVSYTHLDVYKRQAVAKELSSLAQNYPKPFLYALMNLMGSHDRPRILNVLAGNDGSDIPRSQRADHRLSQEERMIGALREQLMLRFVFSVPGMPCIYYGDEAGVEGCADPVSYTHLKAGIFRQRGGEAEGEDGGRQSGKHLFHKGLLLSE